MDAQGQNTSSMRKLRWGIMSTASIGMRAVIPALKASNINEIVAIASRSIDKAQETAAKLDIDQAYGDYESLLESPDVDAVYIPLPNHLHYEWTLRAARAGKHVLCEKPLALDAKQAAEMVQVCKDAGVHLAEAFMYRYHPRYERMKEIIASGEIGEVRGIHGVFTFNNAGAATNVRFFREMGGGGIYDVGCYPITAARLFLGEPEAVTTQAFFSPQHDDVDMMAFGLLEFQDGKAATFECGMWGDGRNTLQIVGSDGRIDVPQAYLYGKDGANFTVTSKGSQRTEQVDDVNQYVLQVDSFARTVLQGEKAPFPPDDSIQNMRVIDACLKSARERVRVSIINE